jgi:hypothetical protein
MGDASGSNSHFVLWPGIFHEQTTRDPKGEGQPSSDLPFLDSTGLGDTTDSASALLAYTKDRAQRTNDAHACAYSLPALCLDLSAMSSAISLRVRSAPRTSTRTRGTNALLETQALVAQRTYHVEQSAHLARERLGEVADVPAAQSRIADGMRARAHFRAPPL